MSPTAPRSKALWPVVPVTEETFATPPREYGILQNDIIVGIDGKKLEMTARQLDAHVRLNYDKGDTVVVQLLRQGERLELKMKLAP